MSVLPSTLQTRNGASKGTKYQIRISSLELDKEWDVFVAKTPGGSHVQTSAWAQVKAVSGWQAIRIILHDSDNILCGGQILFRKVMPYIVVGFMPKGPILSPLMYSSLEPFFSALHLAGKECGLKYLAIQPPCKNELVSFTLTRYGFKPSWMELASTATILIDLSQEPGKILAQMKRQTRQNIMRSERGEITCREGDENDLSTFYRLHSATSQRQGFTPFSECYYQKMWHIFKPLGYIKLIIAEFHDEAVSALLLVPFGDSVVAKILGWSGQYRELRPNDAVFWASILWAKAHGYHYFDLEGIDRRCAIQINQGIPLPDKARDSYTFFKLGYGGKIAIFPLAYDYVYNPVVRQVYQMIFSKPEQWSKFYGSLDRIRRRYG